MEAPTTKEVLNHLQVQLTRQGGMLAAYGELITAMFDLHPERQRVLTRFQTISAMNDAATKVDDLSVEDTEAISIARELVLRDLTANGPTKH